MLQTYRNFDLLVTKAGSEYQARVVESPAGNAAATFATPLTDLDLQGIALALEEARGGGSGKQAVQRFGEKLFTSIFKGLVGELFHRSRDIARSDSSGLRLRLRLTEVPELAIWPWEYLYDPVLGRHLALSDQTPIVRYADLPDTVRPISAQPPLKILSVISSPSDQPPLDVEHEWANLKDALKQLEDARKVSLIRLDQPNALALRQMLRRETIHVLHFVGHGVFDRRTNNGVLLFESAAGTSDPVSASNIGTLLHDHESLRLVILNACKGAEGSNKGAFVGVAQGLIGQGIPATVAMQYEISDPAAIAFSSEFYRALVDGAPVDVAVGEGRIAIQMGANDVEWGVPVVYLRATEGNLFDTGKAAAMTDEPAKESGGIRIDVGGDVSGKIIAGEGDVTYNEGDEYNVGNISGSTVAIGRGASASVSHNQTITIFNEARQLVDQQPVSEPRKADAKETIEKLEGQNKDDADPEYVKHYLDRLIDLAPDVAEVLVNALLSPGAAVNGALKVAIKAWREARKA